MLTRTITAGANALRLPATIKGKRLAKGVYRVSVRATDAAGNRSALVRRTLTVR